MRDWNMFWNSIDTNEGGNNDWPSMMIQVGKTLQGQPISDEQFRKTYEKIIKTLSLEKTDIVLDLCCGNGVITNEISKHVHGVFGVDFSQPLTDVANSQRPNNSKYICKSAIDDSLAQSLGMGNKIKKIYMNESLQNFAECDFAKLLDNALAVSQGKVLLYITGIPEKKNIFSFYNTEERIKYYYERMSAGDEPIGTWWVREFMEEVATNKGWHIKTLDQEPDFYTSHYRFDAILAKNI